MDAQGSLIFLVPDTRGHFQRFCGISTLMGQSCFGTVRVTCDIRQKPQESPNLENTKAVNMESWRLNVFLSFWWTDSLILLPHLLLLLYVTVFMLPLSAPLPVVLSPQSLHPSDSRQCVLHPPTWHSTQGPQGVCECVCVCFHAAFSCTICTQVALYMLVFHCNGLVSACDFKTNLPVLAASLLLFRFCFWDSSCNISDF